MSKSKPLYLSRGVLLNFAPYAIMIVHPYRNGLTQYPTNEHGFQAWKTLAMEAPTKDKRKAHAQIQHAETARMAKSMGRELVINIDRWNRMSYNIMLTLNLAKFSQNAEPRDALVYTKQRPLIEHRPDPIWGDNMDGSGKNWMGEILMSVRGVFL